MKLSPFFSSFAHFAHEAVDAGADGLVAVQPLLPTRPRPRHPGGRAPHRPVDVGRAAPAAALDRHPPPDAARPSRWPPRPASAPGWDVAKALAVGADVAMMTSAVLRQGPAAVTRIIGGLQHWLDEHDYESVGAAAGLDELRRHRRPDRLRAGQLPAGAPLVVGPHAVGAQPRAPAASRASSSGVAGGPGGDLRVGCVAAGEPAEPAHRAVEDVGVGAAVEHHVVGARAGPRRRSRGCGRRAHTGRRGRTR